MTFLPRLKMNNHKENNMTFELTIIGRDGYAIEAESTTFGFDGVKQIRNELGVNVQLDVIDDEISIIDCNAFITVPEDIVKKSGLFNKSSKLTISCPPRWGNMFLKTYVSSFKDDTTCSILLGIKSATLEWQFDKEEFLKWWENNGFPTEIEKD